MRSCPRGFLRSVDRGRTGQPLSRESTLIPSADVVPVTEGNTDGRDNASAQTAGVVLDTGMCARSLQGNREISWSASASMRAALARIARHRPAPSRKVGRCCNEGGRARLGQPRIDEAPAPWS